MIRIPGAMTIVRRPGPRGSFSIGELVTDIGEFKVIDAVLDQFEPGRYEGEFVVRRIEPRSNVWRGRVFVETRAILADLTIHQAQEGEIAQAQMPAESDPAEEEVRHAIKRSRPVTSDAQAPANSSLAPAQNRPVSELSQVETNTTMPMADAAHQTDEHANMDAELFGIDIYPLFAQRETVKLDPTVDREQFRRQRDRLKEAGYTFNVGTQSWLAALACAA
jgi:Protein of unknown function (DUF3275)